MKDKAGALTCFLHPEQKKAVIALTKTSEVYSSISIIVRAALQDFLRKAKNEQAGN